MYIVKDISALKSKKSNLETRLNLNYEKSFARWIPLCAAIYVAFSFVDFLVSDGFSLLMYLGVRSFLMFVSIAAFYVSRGRLSLANRVLVMMCPIILGLELVYYSGNAIGSSYLVGFADIILFIISMIPLSFIALFYVLGLLFAPLIAYEFYLYTLTQNHLLILDFTMIVSLILISSLFSNFLYTQLVSLFKLQEQITRQRGRFGEEVRKASVELAALKVKAQMGELAAGVAHDIRSPVAALKVAATLGNEAAIDRGQLIDTAIQRITQIANQLLERYRQSSHSNEIQSPTTSVRTESEASFIPLSSALKSLFEQKKIEFLGDRRSSVQFNFKSDLSTHNEIYLHVNWAEIERALSNLLSNALEAVTEVKNPTVTFELKSSSADPSSHIQITIRDNGPGMNSEFIERVLKGGITHGKTTGTGLGLSTAHRLITENGGRFEIKSTEIKSNQATVEHGTEVTLFFQPVKTPSWHVSELRFDLKQKFIIIDDDPSVYTLWKEKLNQVKAPQDQIFFYASAEAAIQALGKASWNEANYLCDYRIANSQKNGLDLIEAHRPKGVVYLVTNSYDRLSVQTRCHSLGVGLLPKVALSSIQIVSL